MSALADLLGAQLAAIDRHVGLPDSFELDRLGARAYVLSGNVTYSYDGDKRIAWKNTHYPNGAGAVEGFIAGKRVSRTPRGPGGRPVGSRFPGLN